jgi:hypothetical protein
MLIPLLLSRNQAVADAIKKMADETMTPPHKTIDLGN